MKRLAKPRTPIVPMEKATGLCPLYLAWIITDEWQHWFRIALPGRVSLQLADRAERVWAGNSYWRGQFQGRRGRAYLLSFMRHWLSAWLQRQRPTLFERLPPAYCMGHPLP